MATKPKPRALADAADDVVCCRTPAPDTAVSYADTLALGARYLDARLTARQAERVAAMLTAARQLGYLAGLADAEDDEDDCGGCQCC